MDDARHKTGRILVVDDVRTNRDILERRLVTDGHTVVKVPDGQSALAILADSNFDLVLLDLLMPGLSGFDVLKKMKSDPQLRNIPVVIISAQEETDSAIRCIEAGAHDYMPKPFNLKLLRARIQSGLENKQWTDDEREHKQFIQQAFARYLSPVIVSQLVENPDKLVLGGERTDISCVFTDLTGFTHLVEAYEPATVLPLLNRYFEGMCSIILKHEGTIDKIIGDALHAFFGAPLKQNNHADKAVRCAIELDRYARDFVASAESTRLGFGHTRIGVNSGVALVGNFGGNSFFNYTAYGDVVNTAARMESANRYFGTTLCVSADSANQCIDVLFRPIGRLMLKGKNIGVEGFEPLYTESPDTSPIEQYNKAYQQLDEHTDDMVMMFVDLAAQYPNDPLVNYHAKRLHLGEKGTTIVME